MISAWATAMPVGATARNFVRDHVDSNALAYTNEAQKTAMLQRLMHGSPGNREHLAARRILMTAGSTAELRRTAAPSGGVSRVLDLDSTDAAFQTNVTELLLDPRFKSLSADSQRAVMALVRNYPDARSVADMRRMIDKGWFRTMSLEDQQRSLKMIAFLSQYDDGDRAIIENTLDRFLAPGAAYGNHDPVRGRGKDQRRAGARRPTQQTLTLRHHALSDELSENDFPRSP